MKREIEKMLRERDELNRLYHTQAYRGLKYAALGVIAVVIAMLFAMVIWVEELSPKAVTVLRGCAGAGALIFVILIGILSYRVNSRYIENRRK